MTDGPRTRALGEVLITDALDHRPSRKPDFAAESRALAALARTLAERPQDILQRLTDLMLELRIGGSAGISILDDQAPDSRFRWAAVSGAWAHLSGGTMPFDASPCGAVVVRDQALLVEHPEMVFPDAAVVPMIKEILLVPFRVSSEFFDRAMGNSPGSRNGRR